MDRRTGWHFVWSASPVVFKHSNRIFWNEWGIPDHDMKQTNQTTTLPTINLPRHRFGEYYFVNVATPDGHWTDRQKSLHPYTQDHVLCCSATKNKQRKQLKESFQCDNISSGLLNLIITLSNQTWSNKLLHFTAKGHRLEDSEKYNQHDMLHISLFKCMKMTLNAVISKQY